MSDSIVMYCLALPLLFCLPCSSPTAHCILPSPSSCVFFFPSPPQVEHIKKYLPFACTGGNNNDIKNESSSPRDAAIVDDHNDVDDDEHKQSSFSSSSSSSLSSSSHQKKKNVKSLILDSEVLMIETATGKPLPFGTLGVHKQAQFKDAQVGIHISALLLSF